MRVNASGVVISQNSRSFQYHFHNSWGLMDSIKELTTLILSAMTSRRPMMDFD